MADTQETNKEHIDLLLSRINFYLKHRWEDADIKPALIYSHKDMAYVTRYRILLPRNKVVFVTQMDSIRENWMAYYRIRDETLATIALLLGR